jgi:hypothetical protein
MKILRSFLTLTAAMLFLSTLVFSQDMKPLISMDASLAQTQAWLAKAIDKNSTYSSGRNGNITDSISAVKFDGCKLSYAIENERKAERFGEAWPGGANENGAASRPPNYYTTTTTLAFDLKEMDLNGIVLTPLISNSNMQMITIRSREGGQSVSYSTNYGSFSRSGLRFAATMAVKNEAAEQIKAGLAQAMTLCQK